MGSMASSGPTQDQPPRRQRSALDEIAYQRFRRAERIHRIKTALAWVGGILAFMAFVYFALGMVTSSPRSSAGNSPNTTRMRR
jgi:hypothetical protein